MTNSEFPKMLPQIEDLYYLSLMALGSFDEPVPYRTADDAALALTAFAGDSDVDSRLRERLGFARSALKRAGAADNPQRGFWCIAESGRMYLELNAEQGQQRLVTDINSSYADRTADPNFLEEALARSSDGTPVRLTVRELIGQWNVSRRGAAINEQIRQDLEVVGLRTEPDFTTTWIDGEVSLISTQPFSVDEPGSMEPSSRSTIDLGDDISLTVGSLEAANRGVESVALDDSLVQAQSVMMRFDYSQLAVVTGPRTVRGAISWESIAQERLRNSSASKVSDCLIEATVVHPWDHLLDRVPMIVDKGFVLVQGQDGVLLGIVTMADLSVQFADLANPFVLLGEIERWIQRALDRSFDGLELARAVNPDDPDRGVESAANLTLGEMVRVVERPANWDRLRWSADRSVFVEAFQEVRRIRNETMHFSPDPLSAADLKSLVNFLRWIRHLMEHR